MRKEITGPAAMAVVALAVVIAVTVGWYMMNRELKPVPYSPGSATAASAAGTTGSNGISNQPRVSPKVKPPTNYGVSE